MGFLVIAVVAIQPGLQGPGSDEKDPGAESGLDPFQVQGIGGGRAD